MLKKKERNSLTQVYEPKKPGTPQTLSKKTMEEMGETFIT